MTAAQSAVGATPVTAMNGPDEAVAALPNVPAVAVIVVREGKLPVGADEVVAEADGAVFVLGSGARAAALELTAATRIWWCQTSHGLRAGALAHALSGPLATVSLVLLPASPDGRDLAPRLAATMGRPLLAGAEQATCRINANGVRVDAELSRLDGRLTVPVSCAGPAVATLLPGVRTVIAVSRSAIRMALCPLHLRDDVPDVELLETIEPEPATMDLSEANRVVAGGAGLVPRGATSEQGRAVLSLLRDVASAIGASCGATRVATDAGWIGHDRQIGTTGISVDPQLYVAFGVSGASQHIGGLGVPKHVVSVNLDGSAPMTAMADLGIITDAPTMLIELARRLGVQIPDQIAELVGPFKGPARPSETVKHV